MRQDSRAPFVSALRRAREAAFPAGEYVGQESFMRASEIRQLARRARVGTGVSVLDLCCGVGGPGRMITAELDCRYLGLDYSASAIEIARALAAELGCRFEQRHLGTVPDGRFEVVFLLETLLAFRDKKVLLDSVARCLEPGGRFVLTVEEGKPLTAIERAQMPDADTVWPIELRDLRTQLRALGLTVTWQEQCSASHHAVATALLRSFLAESAEIARQIGSKATAELVEAHRLWCNWLESGRIRKFAMVAEKRGH